MGRYSHLPAVLLALLADTAPRAYAHPIVRESLAARQTSNASDEEPKKASGPSVAAITGTAIGAGVIFFIFCFIVFWVYKRKPGARGKRRRDVERGDAQRDGQGRQREAAQRGETRRREPQWPAPAVAPLQPVPAEHLRSASESPALLPVMGERKREQGYKKEQQQQQQQRRDQARDQKQKQLKRSQTYPSPHQFAAELPAGEDLRPPPMARINGFNMVLPPLLPPPTRPPNHPLPPTPPPKQPLPAPPAQQQQPAPLSTPLKRPTPPPTHPLPPIPTPTRPPRPDTPQLPPTRTRKPSRQNLTTAASPPRLTPLNTRDVRTPTTSRPRAGTGPREISPKTVLIPTHHQEQPQPQPQPQATPPHQIPQTPQQRPHTPQRQQYQQPHQHPHHQPTHAHHQRDQSQQTLIPSPDSAWSLSTFGANNQQDNNYYHPASAVTGSYADRFPVSPETPSGGGGGTTGTVYVAFGERVPTQRTRKASVWTLQDSSDWPVPLAMTRHPTASDGRPRQAGGGSGGR